MICTKCNKEGEFSFKNYAKNIRHTVCKTCQKEYTTKHYKNNKTNHINRNKQFVINARIELHKVINDYKDKPCLDCKVKYSPWIMEFDHIDPSNKFMAISEMINRRYQLHKILEEIAKCELVCSNCHQDRGYKRRQKNQEGRTLES